MANKPIYQLKKDKSLGYQVYLTSPTAMPKSTSFLWNEKMMIQMNCRGFATAQFMQPEPAKYAYAPNMEAKTFMQPEQPYYLNHPGRFFYIKENGKNLFSVPYEPVKAQLDSFEFIVSDNEISWHINQNQLAIKVRLSLIENAPCEHWSFEIKNLSSENREVEVFPYFPIGYMSWMNQSGHYDEALNAIVGVAVTPYQKVEQYYQHLNFKDLTFFASDTLPNSWTASQSSFEGEGSLVAPEALLSEKLPNQSAFYETPTASMQFQMSLSSNEAKTLNFLFGAAKNKEEITELIKSQFQSTNRKATRYEDNFKVETSDSAFDAFINQWLPRQISYHQELNRMTTDPQTRNYLQDHLGMAFINPQASRAALLRAISQQHKNGAMPDGVLLHENAELKYINQVPHADHAVWLPIVLLGYLNETNDKSILEEEVSFTDSDASENVQKHLELAIDKLITATDERGLSYIEQGDWCDPMNMVGHKGKGVSAWLTMATAHAINCWTDICQYYLPPQKQVLLDKYRSCAKRFNQVINEYFWQGNWYARGITDEGRLFGVKEEKEGQIYLNAQTWAILCGAANVEQTQKILKEIEKRLHTPYGPMMLAPSYTEMVEDIGRLTQKYPGVSENGSVYNHAAAFYIYCLYKIGESQKAFDLLKKMIPNIESAIETGQLPTFIPNYYRGAYHQIPSHAGRSSQLVHTGTISWIYRCIIEQLCGIKGSNGELTIAPQLPKEFDKICGTRNFLGAKFSFEIEKAGVPQVSIWLNRKAYSGNIINNISAGKHYQLHILVPHDSD